MAFGEVLGFASAMFALIGQWPQSLRSDFCRPPACVPLGRAFRLLSPRRSGGSKSSKVTL